MGILQNEDVKSEAELLAAGGAKAQLVNDTKIYVTANSINKRLDEAITDGDIGGGGSTNLNVRTESANYTAVLSDDLILCDTTTGFTVDLPTAVGNDGKRYWIKKISADTNALVIDPNGAETVDGNATLELYATGAMAAIVSDGVNWVRAYVDDLVSAFYTSDSGQVINATPTTVIFEDKTFDTTDSYNALTGIYTFPSDGVYACGAGILTIAQSFGVGQGLSLTASFSGPQSSAFDQAETTAVINLNAHVPSLVSATKGQTLSFAAQGTVATTLLAQSDVNYFYIFKVSN